MREAEFTRRKNNLNQSENSYPKPDYLGISILLVHFFFFLFVYILLESIIVPLTKDLYGWSSEYAIKTVGIALSIVGVYAFIVFFICSRLTRIMDERKVYIFFGIVPLIIAMLFHLPIFSSTLPMMQNCTQSRPFNFSSDIFPNNGSDIVSDDLNSMSRNKRSLYLNENLNFILNFRNSYADVPSQNHLIHNVQSQSQSESTHSRIRRAIVDDDSPDTCDAGGCPAYQTWCLTTPIIEKWQLVVGNLFGVFGYPIAFTIANSLFSKMTDPAKQGISMGLLTSIGSLSRMSGPVFVMWLYSSHGTVWTFSLLAAIMFVMLVLALAVYQRLVPMDVTKSRVKSRT